MPSTVPAGSKLLSESPRLSQATVPPPWPTCQTALPTPPKRAPVSPDPLPQPGGPRGLSPPCRQHGARMVSPHSGVLNLLPHPTGSSTLSQVSETGTRATERNERSLRRRPGPAFQSHGGLSGSGPSRAGRRPHTVIGLPGNLCASAGRQPRGPPGTPAPSPLGVPSAQIQRPRPGRAGLPGFARQPAMCVHRPRAAPGAWSVV